MCATTPSSQVTLPADLASGRLARSFVEQHWCSTHGGEDHSRVHLLVTELVTNAVRHAGPPVVFTIDCVGADGVLVSVSDGSDEPPVLAQAGPAAVGGRGVQLVNLLSVEWGVEHHHRSDHPDGRPGGHRTGSPAGGGGKTVWCRLVA